MSILALARARQQAVAESQATTEEEAWRESEAAGYADRAFFQRTPYDPTLWGWEPSRINLYTSRPIPLFPAKSLGIILGKHLRTKPEQPLLDLQHLIDWLGPFEQPATDVKETGLLLRLLIWDRLPAEAYRHFSLTALAED